MQTAHSPWASLLVLQCSHDKDAFSNAQNEFPLVQLVSISSSFVKLVFSMPLLQTQQKAALSLSAFSSPELNIPFDPELNTLTFK